MAIPLVNPCSAITKMGWLRVVTPAIDEIIIIEEAIIADRGAMAEWVETPAGRNRTIIALEAGSLVLIER
jgi:hypothetical protein